VSVMNTLTAEHVGESSSVPDSCADASLREVAHRVPVLASALHCRKTVSAGCLRAPEHASSMVSAPRYE